MRLEDTGLTAEELKAKSKRYIIETYERYDFIADYGKDQFLYDEQGTPYLDFYAGIAVNSVGNCNERVVKAAQEQCATVMQTFNYPYTVPQVMLAELICNTIGLDKIFYQNSGSEANEAMIKMARKYGVEKYGPGRYKIISAKKSFHGRTFGALSATGQPDTAIQINLGDITPGFEYAEFNNAEDFISKADENTIAFMIELVQGEGGVNPATPEFVKALRDYADEHGLLLLIDEVQTGWCRTGATMCYMNYGIKPDIVSMAKAMGGGLPIGAICATDEVAKAFSAGSHGSTFGGHPVSCAAAYAAISEMLEKNLAAKAKETGEYLMEKLRKLPHVEEVRGMGLMIGIEFEEGYDSVEIKHACFDRKLLTTAIGNSVIRIVPPLIITKEDCDRAVDIFAEAIRAVK